MAPLILSRDSPAAIFFCYSFLHVTSYGCDGISRDRTRQNTDKNRSVYGKPLGVIIIEKKKKYMGHSYVVVILSRYRVWHVSSESG